MKSKQVLLMAILSLIMSAIAHTTNAQPVQAQAAKGKNITAQLQIPITTLPITITAPGSYYLATDMYFDLAPPEHQTAISVNSPGKVTIDLNGHALSAWSFLFVGIHNPDGPYIFTPNGIWVASSNVTIKNGTFFGFSNPILASAGQNYISNIRIQSVNFAEYSGYGPNSVQFYHVNNSIVKDCQFTVNNTTGIIDTESQTGNRYVNDRFSGYGLNAIQIISGFGSVIPMVVHRITPEKLATDEISDE